MVLRKVVPFGGLENLNLKFNWVIKSQKSKFYNGAYGKFKKNLNCHNSSCTQDRVVIFDSRVGFLGTASFKFTYGDPCCHGNEIWGKIGYNSACIWDIYEIFVYNGVSGWGYWIKAKFTTTNPMANEI